MSEPSGYTSLPLLIHEVLATPQAPNDEISRLLVAAQTFHHDNAYDHAFVCLEDAIDKWASLCKNRKPPLEVCLYFHCAIAEIHESIGRDDEAKATYEAAVVIGQTLPESHIDVTIPLVNIGRILYHAQQYHSAIEYFQKAKTLREEVLGDEHVDTCSAYNNLGAVLLIQGEPRPCLDLFTKCLQVFQRELGMEHPRTIAARQNMDLTKSRLASVPRKIPALPPCPPKPEWVDPKKKKKKKGGKKKKK
ncbi:hypothetical protein BLNAU_918 [Blattamonas nauphoetae]|uniref:Tetratricopeptide repeat protein n=1 Tax=Blattamonas nauphoetae TaxID=2049346 RepID=A0ABQ9YKW5_9EUKA|nr:hypothetical protein BLNAU_918 [Blattamonas nauphoetae]